MPRPFDYSLFTNVNPKLSGNAAMAVVTALQNYPKEVQLAGLAVAFTSMCQQFDAHQGNALNVAQNLLQRESHAVPELRAARLYIEKEL